MFPPKPYGFRTLSYAYHRAGLEIEPDISGIGRILSLGGSAGIIATLTSTTKTVMRVAPNLGDVEVGALSDAHTNWPRKLVRSKAFGRPALCEKDAILGGAFSISQPSGVSDEVCSRQIQEDFLAGVAGRALWASRNSFATSRGRAKDYMDGRAGGPVDSTRDFAPDFPRRTFGADRLRALLSGISEGTRRRYQTAW